MSKKRSHGGALTTWHSSDVHRSAAEWERIVLHHPAVLAEFCAQPVESRLGRGAALKSFLKRRFPTPAALSAGLSEGLAHQQALRLSLQNYAQQCQAQWRATWDGEWQRSGELARRERARWALMVWHPTLVRCHWDTEGRASLTTELGYWYDQRGPDLTRSPVPFPLVLRPELPKDLWWLVLDYLVEIENGHHTAVFDTL